MTLRLKKVRAAAGALALTCALLSCGDQARATLGSVGVQSGADRSGPKAQAVTGAWTDNFDTLNLARWSVSTWPGFWQKNGITGGWRADNVSVNGRGQLVLRMQTRKCAAGFCVQGAELSTHQAYGFGRYTYRLRMATTSADPARSGRVVPGSISAAFNFISGSETEIDVELDGHRPNGFWATVWNTTSRQDGDFLDAEDQSRAFHTYTVEWRRDSVAYFLDGEEVWRGSDLVPQTPAPVFFNLWPTNEPEWGGYATPGTVYMLVDSVSYQPF